MLHVDFSVKIVNDMIAFYGTFRYYVREIGCEYIQFAFEFAEKLCWTSAVREKVQGTKCTFLFYLN